MKTKLLFILLLFIPVFFTSCEEEEECESCDCTELGGSFVLNDDGELFCDFSQ